jgi:hypothetical protein
VEWEACVQRKAEIGGERLLQTRGVGSCECLRIVLYILLWIDPCYGLEVTSEALYIDLMDRHFQLRGEFSIAV